MAKREFRGCRCGCGQGTWGNYAPGHDSKHVSKLVSRVVKQAADCPWQTGQAWQAAVRELPTVALQRKFRSAMYRGAQRHLDSIIVKMADLRWQRGIHLQQLLARDDEYFNRDNPFSPDVLATWAAALGWTRQSVNMKRS